MNYAIVTAAGKGTRFGGGKALHPLRGRPLLAWAVSRFEANPSIDEIVVTIPADEMEAPYRLICEKEGFQKVRLIAGADSRYDSVRRAFLSLPAPVDLVLIHDAARPLITGELLQRVLDAVQAFGAVIPVLPVDETVKEVDRDWIVRTIPRDNLFVAQTPQGFKADILSDAYSKIKDGSITDEAMLVERAGYKVYVVKGERQNIKITELSDIQIAESFL